MDHQVLHSWELMSMGSSVKCSNMLILLPLEVLRLQAPSELFLNLSESTGASGKCHLV